VKQQSPSQKPTPDYLAPYVQATALYGAGFAALLWASPETQEARFDAAARAYDVAGKALLDVGCGLGDFHQFLISQGIRPARYIGLEAVPALADAAERRGLPNTTIMRGDFVRHPTVMSVGADVVFFSGSLNTLGRTEFYATLRHAFHAAGEALVFNFLNSPALAGRSYLTWHTSRQVLSFARGLTGQVRLIEDYLPGDCTAVLEKQPPGPRRGEAR
jgi:SAM-dependent methyltransferase